MTKTRDTNYFRFVIYEEHQQWIVAINKYVITLRLIKI